MDIHSVRDELQRILTITETGPVPIRGPYQAKPRVSLVDVESEGYRDLERGVWMAATRPLNGSEVKGKNPACYYPVGFVHAQLNEREQIAQNVPLDAQFIIALDRDELRALARDAIDNRYIDALASMPVEKQQRILDETAKRVFSQTLVSEVLERVQGRCDYLDEHGDGMTPSFRG